MSAKNSNNFQFAKLSLLKINLSSVNHTGLNFTHKCDSLYLSVSSQRNRETLDQFWLCKKILSHGLWLYKFPIICWDKLPLESASMIELRKGIEIAAIRKLLLVCLLCMQVKYCWIVNPGSKLVLVIDPAWQSCSQFSFIYLFLTSVFVTQRELMRLFMGDIKTDILNSTYCSISKKHFNTKTIFISYSYQKFHTAFTLSKKSSSSSFCYFDDDQGLA